MTTTCVPFSLHLGFLFLLILLLFPPDGHCHGGLCRTQLVSPWYFQSTQPHPCSWSSTDSFDVQKEGEGLWDCAYKVCSSGQSCPRPWHSLTTHSADSHRASSSPASSIVSTPHRCPIFHLLYRIFTVLFLRLDIQILTNCMIIDCSIQSSSVLYRFVA